MFKMEHEFLFRASDLKVLFFNSLQNIKTDPFGL